MNWTGGRLQRHSKNAGSGVVSRQKQHFAKVRTQLQSGAHPGQLPFQPSFLIEDNINFGGRLPPFTDRSSRNAGHSRGHQKKAQRTLTSDEGDVDGAGPQDPAASLVLTKSQAKITGGKPIEKGKMKMKSQPSRNILEDELLESSRKRLLAQRDWLGLESTRPVHITFRTRAEKDRIGKRRKVVGTPARQYTLEVPSIVLPPGQEYEQKWSRLNKKPTQKAREDYLRVRIGTDAFASQRSSTQIRERLHRESSDTMLYEVTRDANVTVATEVLGEHIDDEDSNAGASHNAEYGTALEFDSHKSEKVSQGPYSDHREDESDEMLSSPGLAEDYATPPDGEERDPSESDAPPDEMIPYLPNTLAMNGRLIFQSVASSSTRSNQPTHTNMSSRPAKLACPDNLIDNFSQGTDRDDQDPREHQATDEIPWKKFLDISSDEQSQSSTSGAPDMADLHGAEASISSKRQANRSSADITVSGTNATGHRPGANTLVIARQRNGKTTQEFTTFVKYTKASTDDEKDDGNRLWKKFLFRRESNGVCDTTHDTKMRDGSASPVHSARATSMKTLYSSKVQAKSTSSAHSTPSQSAASSRSRDAEARWGQTEKTWRRPADLASSSLYNNISASISSPVAAAYSNIGLTNYANSDVSIAESAAAYETSRTT